MGGHGTPIWAWQKDKAGRYTRELITAKDGCKLMVTSNVDLEAGVANGTLLTLVKADDKVLTAMQPDGHII
eukprot:4250057-Lingulodinium_polyedra.AAC.1